MRFSIKQLLLLFVLMSLIGGTISSVLRQPPSNEAHHVAVSPDGTKIAVHGAYGFDIYNLETGLRLGSVEWNNVLGAMKIAGSDREIKFLDNDRVVFLTRDGPFGAPRILSSYSISERKETLLDPDVSNRTGMVASNITGLLNAPQIEDSYLVVFDPGTGAAVFHELETLEESTVTYPTKLQMPALKLSPKCKFVVIGELSIYQSRNGTLEFFDRASGQSLGKLDGDLNRIWFTPDDSRVLVYHKGILQMYLSALVPNDQVTEEAELPTDLLEPEPLTSDKTQKASLQDSPVEKAEETGEANSVSVATGPSKNKLEFDELWSLELGSWDSSFQPIEFSQDGSRMAMFTNSFRTSIEVLDASTGNKIQKLESGSILRDSSCFAFHPDNNRLIVCPSISDNPIKVFDSSTGELIKSFGSNWRFFTALFYGFGFVAWSLVWGLFSSDKPQEIQAESADDVPETASIGEELGTTSRDFVEAQIAIPRPTVIDDLIASQAKRAGLPNTSSGPLIAAWWLLGIGGCFAIMWSAIPMFYFENGLLGHLSPVLVFVRLILASFGIFVGVLAATRAFGRSPYRLQTAGIFQIANVVNLDLVNFILGFVVLVLIGIASSRRRIKELQAKK